MRQEGTTTRCKSKHVGPGAARFPTGPSDPMVMTPARAPARPASSLGGDNPAIGDGPRGGCAGGGDREPRRPGPDLLRQWVRGTEAAEVYRRETGRTGSAGLRQPRASRIEAGRPEHHPAQWPYAALPGHDVAADQAEGCDGSGGHVGRLCQLHEPILGSPPESGAGRCGGTTTNVRLPGCARNVRAAGSRRSGDSLSRASLTRSTPATSPADGRRTRHGREELDLSPAVARG